MIIKDRRERFLFIRRKWDDLISLLSLALTWINVALWSIVLYQLAALFDR